ncbi:hypothetical protein K488DRAFT_83966 [Vararia minispora EC-137]|uniref:Uncharacterized protein n=1 Tax=Vararia minispora EC-137 TaxID=1314806 RepID=A0ACB8QRZ9_9AGAM|nr:hypothetical protein K488DRAFT_83966 [Vararia minispora EC-137]
MSPVSQLLFRLGMTREDLHRHSQDMREFLVAGSSPFAPERDKSPTPTPLPAVARERANSRSVGTTDASTSARRDPPPVTPVRQASIDSAASGRKRDTMEAVIEMQNASRRGKRHHTDDEGAPYSPLPGSTSLSASRRDSFTRSRVLRRDATLEDTPALRCDASETSLKDALPSPLARHYRDTVYDQTGSIRRRGTFSVRAEAPSPSRSGRNSAASHRGVSVEVTPRSRGLSLSYSHPSFTTPSKNRQGQLPPSSPAPSVASQYSSPVRPLVNIVSSPGPMGPEPEEEEYDSLPFKLPPGPYSLRKPDAPYAALIGQAILASPQHRLTLQEIYDYITIVWPHFKRNETTWMNSIRHVLSTTVVFRKVQRDRSAGRTLWAIWDEDIECFADGGFRKEYCRDMREQKAKQAAAALARKQSATGMTSAPATTSTPTPASTAVPTSSSASTSTSMPASTSTPIPAPIVAASAASTATRQATTARKTKRAKRTAGEDVTGQAPPPLHHEIPLSMFPSVSYSAPLFPTPIPGSHHQPYYAFPLSGLPPAAAQPIPALPTAGVIFPPLPPSSATAQHLAEVYAASISSSSTPAPEPEPPTEEDLLRASEPLSDVFAISAAPEETESVLIGPPPAIHVDDSTSEPPSTYISDDPDDYLSYPDEDELDTEVTSPAPSLALASSTSSMSLPPPLTPNNGSSSPPEPVEEPKQPPPRPSKRKARPSFDYLSSLAEAPLGAVNPCITVGAQDEVEEHLFKVKARAQSRKGRNTVGGHSPRLPQAPIAPDSPTLMRQAARVERTKTPSPRRTPPYRAGLPIPIKPFVTPPPRSITPRKTSSSGHQLSVQRTPLSHLGVHMSPSPSLAHYKSHLLPPPPATSPPAHTAEGENVLTRTPSRRRSGAAGIFTPLTPRRLAFAGAGDSPFRTPLYGMGVYDPHDPSAALDEELNRIGARASGVYESPAGLFDRGRLYESPSGASPSVWPRLW